MKRSNALSAFVLVVLAAGVCAAQFTLRGSITGIAQAVDVIASAPLLETGQAVVGVSVQQEFISSLPVKGRNFTAFALLAPNIANIPL